MRFRDLAVPALVAGTLLAWPDALSAQADGAAYLEFAVGIGMKPAYGVSDTRGPVFSARTGRFLLPRAALRVEAELQSYYAGEPPVYVTAPCRPTEPCVPTTFTVLGAGPIRMVSTLASLEWYEQADRRGFYLLAGFGPQFVVSHPDRAPALRLAVQAGAGLSIAAAVLVEARYQASVGARAEPEHVVVLSAGLRFTR